MGFVLREALKTLALFIFVFLEFEAVNIYQTFYQIVQIVINKEEEDLFQIFQDFLCKLIQNQIYFSFQFEICLFFRQLKRKIRKDCFIIVLTLSANIQSTNFFYIPSIFVHQNLQDAPYILKSESITLKKYKHKQMYGHRGTRPCRYGPECRYLRQGNCWFFHPQSHSRTSFNPTRVTSSLRTRPSFNSSTFSTQRRFQEEDDDRSNYAESFYDNDNGLIRLFELLGLRRNNSLASIISRRRQNEQSQTNPYLNLLRNKPKQETIQKVQDIIKMTLQTKLKEINGKQIKCGKVNSNLDKQKTWYFENAPHFKFVKECGYQQCSICLQKFEVSELTTQLLCKHAFHSSCIHKWLKTSDNCPLCRKNFKEHSQYKQMIGYPKKISPFLYRFL